MSKDKELAIYPLRACLGNPKVEIEHFDSIKSEMLSKEDSHILLGNGFNMHIGVETGGRQLSMVLREDPEVREALNDADLKEMDGENVFDIEDFAAGLECGKEVFVDKFFKLIMQRTGADVKNKLEAMHFLTNFKRIFTTNYDTVLYFLMVSICEQNHRSEWKDKHTNKNDGFGRDLFARRLVWKNKKCQNYFYLHGSFHMYEEKGCIYKRTRETEYGLHNTLCKYTGDHIGIFKRDCKEAAIKKNKYLLHCYRQLESLSGALYIMGWRCADKDLHLARAIRNSNAKPVYVSVHFNPENKSNPSRDEEAMQTIRNFRHHLNNKELVFFDIATVSDLKPSA